MKPSRHRRGAQFEYALGAPAGALPPGVTISRMDMLRRSGRDAEAVAHLRKVVTTHPDMAVGLLAALRAAGRPADIEMLLDVIAGMDAEVCARVAAALSSSRDLDDLTSLLNRLEKRGLSELAAVAVACEETASAGESRTSGVHLLMARLLNRPAYEVTAAIRDLRRRDREREADNLLTVFCHAPGPAVRDAAVDLAKQGMRAEAATLLHRYAVTAPPLDAAESFCELTRKWTSAATLLAPVLVGRQDSARVLAALRTLAPDQFPESLLGLLTYQHVVALCGGLSAQNATMELDTVLTWCAGREDAAELRSVLHEAGLHALGYRLAERVDEMSRSFDHPA